MSDTILSKEIAELRLQVDELKEMVRQLLVRVPEKKTHRTNDEIRDETFGAKNERTAKSRRSRPYPVPLTVQGYTSGVVCTPGEVEHPVVPPYKPHYNPAPLQGEQPGKLTEHARLYPERYNVFELWNEDALPIVSAPPKHNPNAPIYKPA